MTVNRLSDKEMREIYEVISTYHNEYLAEAGVKLPQLEKGGKFTKKALVLVYLAQGYPNTQWVTKDELTEFVRLYYPNINDVQSGRHLGMQSGFYIVSSRRGNFLPASKSPPQGSAYLLVTLEKPYPAFVPKRRSSDADSDFETVKQKYDYRCATCGSKEGEMNLRYKNQRTQLQRGHRNPKLPLEGDNIIPLCQFCNRADRNYWVYDERGRVVGVAAVKPITRSIEKGYLSEQEVQSLYEYLSRRRRRRRKRDGEKSTR